MTTTMPTVAELIARATMLEAAYRDRAASTIADENEVEHWIDEAMELSRQAARMPCRTITDAMAKLARCGTKGASHEDAMRDTDDPEAGQLITDLYIADVRSFLTSMAASLRGRP